MKVDKFERSDLDEINSWYRERSCDQQSHGDLPDIGYIVHGVAAGFLYKTDSNKCMIESMITNPAASKKDRHDALDAITVEILSHAKLCGFKQIFGLTKCNMLTNGAQNVHGFLLGKIYQSVMKEL